MSDSTMHATSNLPVPEAFWFGADTVQCFGVLHRPATLTTRAVVICNGVGFDGLLAHRTLRILATQLAGCGLAVLRFDYPGVGDSTGDEWEPNLVTAWIESVGAAIEAVRKATSTDEVHLMGLRIGAAIALLHAETRTDIAGISMWSPCVKGSSFVREMRALAKFRAATRPQQHIAAEFTPTLSRCAALEVVGFEFTKATLDELAEIDIGAERPTRAAPNLFVLDRDDITPSGSLVAAMNATGATVRHETFAGYTEFMTDDETSALLPQAALDQLVQWHRDVEPVPTESRATSTTLAESIDVVAAQHGTDARRAMPALAMTESPLWIADHLLAIVTRPTAPAERCDAAIVLANTGSVNRAGPGRLHVQLARYWASLGYSVIRVDLGGTGDSAPQDAATENAPYAPDRLHELDNVVEAAHNLRGIRSVASFGICSGAFNNLHVALSGSRVDTIMMVNPLIFSLDGAPELRDSHDQAVLSAHRLSIGLRNRSWSDVRVRHGGMMGALRRARDLLADGALGGYRQLAKVRAQHVAQRLHLRPRNTATVIDNFNRLARQGVNLVLVFAADEPGERYLQTIGGHGYTRAIDEHAIHVMRIAGGDHVFGPAAARQQLIAELTAVLQQLHPVAALTSARVS